MSEVVQRHVGFLAEPHFALAEMPAGVMLELDVGVPVIILGTQADDSSGEHETALCQVQFQRAPAAVYIPWVKLSVEGLRSFEIIDEEGTGLPFPWVR